MITYEFTATNRGNIDITNFVMRDPLLAVSKLALPIREPNIFDDGLIEGEAGTIKTIAKTLAARNENCFYFNTEYGLANNN